MRVSILILTFALMACPVRPQTARADDKVYICAIMEARACTPNEACKTVALQDLYLAPLIIIDLAKKAIVSAAMDDRGRQEPIDGFERTKSDLIVYGHGEDETWSAIVALKSGAMTGSINTGETAHVVFGHCAPHKYPG